MILPKPEMSSAEAVREAEPAAVICNNVSNRSSVPIADSNQRERTDGTLESSSVLNPSTTESNGAPGASNRNVINGGSGATTGVVLPAILPNTMNATNAPVTTCPNISSGNVETNTKSVGEARPRSTEISVACGRKHKSSGKVVKRVTNRRVRKKRERVPLQQEQGENPSMDNATAAAVAAAHLLNVAIATRASSSAGLSLTPDVSGTPYPSVNTLTPSTLSTPGVSAPAGFAPGPPNSFLTHQGLIPFVHIPIPQSSTTTPVLGRPAQTPSLSGAALAMPMTVAPLTAPVTAPRAVPIAPLSTVPAPHQDAPFLPNSGIDLGPKQTAVTNNRGNCNTVQIEKNTSCPISGPSNVVDQSKARIGGALVGASTWDETGVNLDSGVSHGETADQALLMRLHEVQPQPRVEEGSKQRRMLRNRESAARSRDKQKTKTQLLEASIADLKQQKNGIDDSIEELTDVIKAMKEYLSERGFEVPPDS